MSVETKNRRISIDPITRLEGHGKIDIFLTDEGDVANATCRFRSCAASSSSAWGVRPRTCPT